MFRRPTRKLDRVFLSEIANHSENGPVKDILYPQLKTVAHLDEVPIINHRYNLTKIHEDYNALIADILLTCTDSAADLRKALRLIKYLSGLTFDLTKYSQYCLSHAVPHTVYQLSLYIHSVMHPKLIPSGIVSDVASPGLRLTFIQIDIEDELRKALKKKNPPPPKLPVLLYFPATWILYPFFTPIYDYDDMIYSVQHFKNKARSHHYAESLSYLLSITTYKEFTPT